MYKTPHITYVQNYFCTYLFLFIYGKYEQNPLTLEKSAFQRFEWVLSETFWKNKILHKMFLFCLLVYVFFAKARRLTFAIRPYVPSSVDLGIRKGPVLSAFIADRKSLNLH